MVETPETTLTRSPYEILNISPWSTLEDIKAQYFILVKQYNPEYYPDEFIEIRTAYDLLKEPTSRAATDVEMFCPPPPCRYSEYPEFPEHPLSMFKLNQEYKAVCGESDPTELEGDARGQAVKILKGMFLYQSHQGNWDEAQEIGSKILEMVPEDEETLQNALCGHWQEGYEAACKENYAKAEDFFQQLTEKRSDIGVIYQNIALAQERQGKKEDAVESWRKALEQLQSELKKNPESEYKKALVLAIHKYTGGKLLDEKQDGSVSGSDKEMGYACIKQGNWKQAASALERAHHTNPDDIDVLCQLGWAYLNTNQNAKAFKMWNMAHKKSGGKSQVVDHLVKGYSIFGKRLKEQRIYNQALVQFKNALKFEPNNLELRAELADTYFQMRNFSTAMREYQKILDVEPRNKAARQGMRESKRLGGVK